MTWPTARYTSGEASRNAVDGEAIASATTSRPKDGSRRQARSFSPATTQAALPIPK